MQAKKIKKIMDKFEEFRVCIVDDATLEQYDKFFESKLKARHKPKTKATDLSRA